MSDDNFIKGVDCTIGIIKWIVLQIVLYFLTPYLWNYENGVGTIVSILMYTSFYRGYWDFMPNETRIRWIFLPYLAYL